MPRSILLKSNNAIDKKQDNYLILLKKRIQLTVHICNIRILNIKRGQAIEGLIMKYPH